MHELRVALLQIAPGENLLMSREKGIQACREAKKLGADIALFPEMFSNGYRIYDRPVAVWSQEAISAEDPFVLSFGKLAQ